MSTADLSSQIICDFASRRIVGHGSTPMTVKAEIGLARLFHERYRWAPLLPPSRDRAMLLFKFCAVCDAPFVPVRRDARFCGNACRQREYRRRKAARRAARPGRDRLGRRAHGLRAEAARAKCSLARQPQSSPPRERNLKIAKRFHGHANGVEDVFGLLLTIYSSRMHRVISQN